jgi:hypothetical protein
LSSTNDNIAVTNFSCRKKKKSGGSVEDKGEKPKKKEKDWEEWRSWKDWQRSIGKGTGRGKGKKNS